MATGRYVCGECAHWQEEKPGIGACMIRGHDRHEHIDILADSHPACERYRAAGDTKDAADLRKQLSELERRIADLEAREVAAPEPETVEVEVVPEINKVNIAVPCLPGDVVYWEDGGMEQHGEVWQVTIGESIFASVKVGKRQVVVVGEDDIMRVDVRREGA